MSPEELFNHCLSELESPDTIEVAPLTGARFPTAIPDSIFHLTQPPGDPLLLAQICINCSRSDIIKVMKSGIFYKGGLRGRQLTRGNFGCIVYYFNNLISFILQATSYIVNTNQYEYLSYYNLTFDRAINQIDKLKSIASTYNSKRNLNKLHSIKNDLEHIKSDILENPVIVPPHRLNGGGDNITSLIHLFKRQLPPETPELIIAGAISKLFQIFKIFVESEAIRQRMKRAKQK